MLRVRSARAPAELADDTSGKLRGPLQAYFDKLTELEQHGRDDFFAIVAEVDGPKFVQVSAGEEPGGDWGCQFNLPLVDWSKQYGDQIIAEAKDRGFEPIVTQSVGMEFLDIDFANRSDHDSFARWVMVEVFGLPETGPFEISWG